jgi:tRNA G18 (ribose-2'-O)-methylase SpoU
VRIVELPDLADPALAPYRTLRRQREHLRQGIFVAEGPAVVERLLRSDRPVVSALMTRRWVAALEPLLAPREGPVFVADERLYETITGFPFHQGVMAVGRCPPEPTLAEVLAGARPPRFILALDGLTSAENVGVVLRSSSALGATAVLSGERSASPFLRRAVRSSMGGVLFVPVLHVADLAATLGRLAREHGFRVVAAEAHGGAPLATYAFPPDACVVLGHESEGLSPAVRAACADSVTIPVNRALDSLNVATAAALFLHEFRRQRG